MQSLLTYGNLPPILLQGMVIGIWLGLVGAVAETVHRHTPTVSEIPRKIVHIGAGHVILLAWWLETPTWMGLAASGVFSVVALLSYRLPILPGINGVGRPSLGTFFYAISVGVLTAVFWPLQQPEFAVLGVLTMAWGDGLAALVGQAYGRHPYRLWGSTKSWEGSFTMGLATFGVCSAILCGVYGLGMVTLGIAALVAIAATGLEAFSKLGIDNLTVPLGSAALAFGLVQGWLG